MRTPNCAVALLNLIILIFCVTLSADGVADTLELANANSLRDLSRYVDFLEDPDGRMDSETVRHLDDEAWSQTNERALQLGYSTSVWWVRFNVINSGTMPAIRILEADWPLLNYLDAHVYENGREIATVLTGDQRPFVNRPLQTRTYAIPLKVPPGTQQTILLRLAMRSGIFYAVPLRLWKELDFQDSLQRSTLIQGAYLGAILALLLYNALLFLSTRDNIFLLYSAYLTVFSLWYCGFRGYGMQYFWQDAARFNLQFNLLIPAYAHGLTTLFVVRYLETRERLPFLHKIILIVTALALSVMPFSVLNQFDHHFSIVWPAYFYTGMSNLLILLYLVAGVWLVYRQYRPARFFVIAWICLMAGIMTYRLTEFPGFNIGEHPLIENSISLGSALEFLLLALALGDRFNQLREEKLQVEQEAYRLQVNYSNDLTEQVECRTNELKKTTYQLRQVLDAERKAQEEQKQFLATVSHELRTPLTVIDIVTQNLEMDEDKTTAAERRSRYDKILRATRRLSSLLDNSLDENRFSMLRRGPQSVMVDLRQLLEDAATSARVLADGHTLVVETHNLPDSFLCDPDLTRLALRSLADNAVKYTPPGTAVVLSGEANDAGVSLCVRDEGVGLSITALERFFLPGQRGQDTSKFGRGMGLPLARRMIETQGGTLTATSQPGKGSLFRIWLPNVTADSAPSVTNPVASLRVSETMQ